MRKLFSYLSRKKLVIALVIVFILLIIFIYIVNNILVNARLSQAAYVSTGIFPTYPTLDLKNKTQEEIKQIRSGEFLVKASDCIACHTIPDGKHQAFSGGLPMQTPFGVVYSPNITPDRKTGIGTWTEKQFITAMHEGIAPSGYYYYPAFPYLYFNKITPSDLRAIKAYLDVIPAVNQQNKENNMIFPFNWRFLQLGWRILFFYPERSAGYQYNSKQSAAWNLGAYIVQGPGHCAMCHTPSYYIVTPSISLGAPIRKYDLTGAEIEGYLAPNITKTNLGGIPDNELLKIFTQYQMIGGAPIQGPMYEAIHESLKQLPESALLAMLQYLKTVESKLPPQPSLRKTDIGKSIYNNYCSACHQAGIGGAPRFGDQKTWEAFEKSGVDKLYSIAIHGGGAMPAKGTCITCSDYEVELAVDYMIAASRNSHEIKSENATEILSNQNLYQANCSSCHSNPQSKAPQLGDQKAWSPIEAKGFLKAYENIITGKSGHPDHAGCPKCSDSDILGALKYMMQKGNPDRNYSLW